MTPADNAAEVLPPAIATQLAAIETERAKLLTQIPHAAVAEGIAAQFAGKWPARNAWSKNVNVTVGRGFGQLTGVLIQLDALDSDCVAPVLRELRKRGYAVKGHSDYAEMGRRTYDLGEIQVSLFVPTGDENTGARCKFVVKGYEQKPVYELMCDDKAVEAES